MTRNCSCQPLHPYITLLSWISCYHIPETLLSFFPSSSACLRLYLVAPSLSSILPLAVEKGGMRASGFFLPSHLASRQACSLFLGQVLSEQQIIQRERLSHPSSALLCVWTSRYFPCVASSAGASLLCPSSSFFQYIFTGLISSVFGLSPNKPRASPYFTSIL